MFNFKDFDALNQHVSDQDLLQEPDIDKDLEEILAKYNVPHYDRHAVHMSREISDYRITYEH